jgi:integrase
MTTFSRKLSAADKETMIRRKGLHCEIDHRNGTRKYYFRLGHEKRVPLSGEPNSPGFIEQYRAALYGRPSAAAPKKAKVGRNDPSSLQWLIDAYLAWMAPKTGKGYADATKKQHRTVLTRIGLKHGDVPFRVINSQDIIDIRDANPDAKAMANKAVAVVEALYDWAGSAEASKALDGRLVQVNPAVGVKRHDRTDEEEGHHAWERAEQRVWENAFPIGTRGRIIYELMQLGMACVDACAACPEDLFTNPKGELCISTKRQKTKKSFTVPVTPSLKAAIDAGPCGKTTFFGAEKTNEPLAAGYVSGWMARTCDEIGIPDCTAHGLRHTAITRALEAGASEKHIMAHFGLTIAVAAKYVKSFNDKKAAEGGEHFFARGAA